MLDQTLIIYTSDNGGDDIAYTARTSFPRWPKYYAKQGIPKDEFPWIGGGHKIRGGLAGSKASMKEGGHRVPMIVHWPQFIKTAKVSDTMFSQMDMLASFGSLLNVPIPKGEAEDSKDALVNLLGMEKTPIRKEFIIIGKDGSAIRQDDWKLCIGDWSVLPDHGQKPTKEKSVRLFNIKKDMGETTNLAKQFPEKVIALSALLEQYLAEYKKR